MEDVGIRLDKSALRAGYMDLGSARL